MPFVSSSSSSTASHAPHPIPSRPQGQQTMAADTSYSGYAQRARGFGAWGSNQTYAASASAQNGHTKRDNSSPDQQSPASPASSAANPHGMQQALSSAPTMQRKGSSGEASEKDREDRDSSRIGRDWDRDKPRDREERDRDRSSTQEDEVISTIFVVGFPDDMQEREFQNIFTFSTGFEAATLKFPSGSSATPRNIGQASSSMSDIAGNDNDQQAQSQALEEALAALQLGGGHTLQSTHPTSSTSSTAAPTPVVTQPAHSSRRQTIGFARFRSRQDALAARDYLQGRKIDPLTGATLKAEMAKKNLHTKRGPAGEELVGMLLRSGRLNMNGLGALGGLAGLGALLQQVQAQAQTSQSSPANQPVQVPQPNGAGKFAQSSWDPNWPRQSGRLPTALAASLPQPPAGYAQKDEPAMHRSMPAFASQTYAAVSQASAYPQQQNSHAQQQPQQAQQQSQQQSQQQPSPSLQMKSPVTRPKDSKALLALAEEADELEGWSVSGINNLGLMEYTQSGPAAPRQSHDFDQSSVGSFGSSPPKDTGSETEAGRVTSHSLNPADQNPPINTLYIGNLPATSPLSHPPNFLEDNLRALFQRSQGFKRMSFRQKLNGPMCFVEFDDVPMAAHAIKELYGHTLGGLVKGGIRLSYSKNSLGQRGNGYPAPLASGNMYTGLAHNVALAGMSQSPPVSAGSTQTSFAHQQQQPAFGRQNSDTPLSPNAQPFASTLPLPLPTSPRSRYFSGGELQPGSYPSQPQQFSPVLSPVRPQPQPMSWLSSSTPSNSVPSTGPTPLYGNGSFDPFARTAAVGPPGGGWGNVGQAAPSK